MVIESVAVIVIGLGGGLAVGSGFVAFLTMLGVVPRLTQLTRTGKYIHAYEWAVIIGAQAGTWFSFYEFNLGMSPLFAIPVGLAAGVFVGMLAAALTEVLNVLPILAKRLGIVDRIIVLLMAIVLGKVIGSLFHWIYFVD
ncbi:stage V sporulation protein AB [Halalkalibacter urbisdiaboli]|uniref:stage V sporulation protein AB n=1 Tax=Halalkalibacter urbisdiaboli TaxID=1960589 RepID=UPI000B44C2E9|nr:stage V sporulation protein AB [Halalkalibacter urbisdiaboli]